MKKVFWDCPKCGHTAAGDHSQCEGKCPLAMSPYYDAEVAAEHGNPVPQLYRFVSDDASPEAGAEQA